MSIFQILSCRVRRMYLEVMEGSAECGLDGGARCGIEVAPQNGGGTVVAHLVQRLRLRRRQVAPGWEGHKLDE